MSEPTKDGVAASGREQDERHPLTAAEALRGIAVPLFPLFPHEFGKAAPKEVKPNG